MRMARAARFRPARHFYWLGVRRPYQDNGAPGRREGLYTVQFDLARSESPGLITNRIRVALRVYRAVSWGLGQGWVPYAALRGVCAGQARSGLQLVPLRLVGL